MLPLNSILQGEFTAVAANWPPECIDFTLTSPPYDDLRNYHGYRFDYRAVISTLYRITKPGGVVIWVVGDQVIKGSESGSSFRQSQAFRDCGFLLHDTMIYLKNTSSFPARRDGNRYTQIFEWMFVFSKGSPKTVNLILDDENKPRTNVWRYVVGGEIGQTDKRAYKHPATFPEALARDHILSWTNPGDVVLDPMSGCGTTCVMVKLLGRKFLGVDISHQYCELASERVISADPIKYQQKCQHQEDKRLNRLRRRQELLAKLTPTEREALGIERRTQ